MKQDNLALKRYNELEDAFKSTNFLTSSHTYGGPMVGSAPWHKWATNVLNLLSATVGESSPHFKNFAAIYKDFRYYPSNLESAHSIFLAAKEDFEGGYLFKLESSISGEVLGDFVSLAKLCLTEGNKDVAAVLASASLEDALKRFASVNGLDVSESNMQEVVAALKSKGLVSGAQKTLLDTMPKLRDYAMHANWGKFKPEDVSGIIGFVEQFLLSNF